MTDNTNIEVVYEKCWAMIGELLVDHSPVAVAGVMVAQAMTIYKTVLPEEEYDAMCTAISNARDKVHKIESPVIQ
jgi:hypothetical protein